jgi:hypothetical protein
VQLRHNLVGSATVHNVVEVPQMKINIERQAMADWQANPDEILTSRLFFDISLQIHFCRDKHGVTNIDNHFEMNTT